MRTCRRSSVAAVAAGCCLLAFPWQALGSSGAPGDSERPWRSADVDFWEQHPIPTPSTSSSPVPPLPQRPPAAPPPPRAAAAVAEAPPLDSDVPPNAAWVSREMHRMRAGATLSDNLVLSYPLEGCYAPNPEGFETELEGEGGEVLHGQEARSAAVSALKFRVGQLLRQKQLKRTESFLETDLLQAAAAAEATASEPVSPDVSGMHTRYLSALQMEVITNLPEGVSSSEVLGLTRDLPCVQKGFRDSTKFIEEPNRPKQQQQQQQQSEQHQYEQHQAEQQPQQQQQGRRLQGWGLSELSSRVIQSALGALSPSFLQPRESDTETNRDTRTRVPPNDPYFQRQWNLHGAAPYGINAEKAWRLWTGTPRPMVIAVIDSGCDMDHPDLRDKRWQNPGEICGDGIDNDNNGFVDDCYGWDFVRNTGDMRADVSGHGTGAAGVLGSSANNLLGMVGVCWGCQVMCLKFIGAGQGTVSNQVQAIDYAVRMGAWISNNSYGGYGKADLEFEAIQRAQRAGHLFVASAGNHNLNTDLQENDHTPSTYPLSNILSVGALTAEGRRAAFSNFGFRTVHVFAPGASIQTTDGAAGYSSMDGTSFACPHVAGAAGLIWSAFPNLTYLEVKKAIMDGCRPSPAFAAVAACGGSLDLYRALVVAAHISSGTPIDKAALDRATLPSPGAAGAASAAAASAAAATRITKQQQQQSVAHNTFSVAAQTPVALLSSVVLSPLPMQEGHQSSSSSNSSSRGPSLLSLLPIGRREEAVSLEDLEADRAEAFWLQQLQHQQQQQQQQEDFPTATASAGASAAATKRTEAVDVAQYKNEKSAPHSVLQEEQMQQLLQQLQQQQQQLLQIQQQRLPHQLQQQQLQRSSVGVSQQQHKAQQPQSTAHRPQHAAQQPLQQLQQPLQQLQQPLQQLQQPLQQLQQPLQQLQQPLQQRQQPLQHLLSGGWAAPVLRLFGRGGVPPEVAVNGNNSS